MLSPFARLRSHKFINRKYLFANTCFILVGGELIYSSWGIGSSDGSNEHVDDTELPPQAQICLWPSFDSRCAINNSFLVVALSLPFLSFLEEIFLLIFNLICFDGFSHHLEQEEDWNFGLLPVFAMGLASRKKKMISRIGNLNSESYCLWFCYETFSLLLSFFCCPNNCQVPSFVIWVRCFRLKRSTNRLFQTVNWYFGRKAQTIPSRNPPIDLPFKLSSAL